MLTPLIRIQLILFTIASVIGMTLMATHYLQLPTLLGIGRITVTLQLPAAGGLYRFSNVTYRGVQVGQVNAIDVRDGRYVEATLSLDTRPRIPTDLVAHVRSMSAVGEQYVDLQPRNESPPYLVNGSVIPADRTTIPQQVGPMMNQVSMLLDSIPQDTLSTMIDESFDAFNGADFAFGSLLDSAAKVSTDLNSVANEAATLIIDSRPLLEGQAQSSDALRTWIRSLGGVTEQVRHNDQQVRKLLQQGPPAADEVSRLLADVRPTLPLLLANLATVGQVAVTYNASLEQLMVLLPPNVAAVQGVSPNKNATGIALGDFAMTMSDPPPCTVGFLPPSSWRSPQDESVIDTPDGIYCKLPHDSPISVRGARNYPCMEHPGKRAPTVELCNSPAGFQPLAQRQHILGPYPVDPNLLGQGVPPDSRANPDEGIFGPLEGTPRPADTEPPAAPETPAAPAGYAAQAPGNVQTAQYNPHTGAYMAEDGRMYSQSNLAESSTSGSWTDLVMPNP